MIKRASSSEIFDLYASKMISKRALSLDILGKGAARLATALGEVLESAKVVGRTSFDDAAIQAIKASNVSSTAKLGAEALSKIDDIALASNLENLFISSRVKESAEAILSTAKKVGYGEFDDVSKFLLKYSDDFKAMSAEYDALTASGNPIAPADAISFVRKHENTIKFFNEMGEGRALSKVLSSQAVAAGKAAQEAGRSSITLADASDLARGAASSSSAVERGSKLLSIVGSLVPIGFLYFLWKKGGEGAFDWVASFLKSPESEEHFEKIKAAIGCIKKIELKPGSPAVAERDKVIDNLTTYSKLQFLNPSQMTDKTERIETARNIAKAGLDLLSQDSGSGSIFYFAHLISEEPSENLSGYFYGKEFASGAGGAAAGAAVGAIMGGPIGAAVGAALVGLPSWYFLGLYYSEELECVLAAADAIKYLNDQTGVPTDPKAISEMGKSPVGTTPKPEERASSGQTVGADNISFLKRVLAAGQNEKLIGIPGIELVNEEKLTQAFVLGAGGLDNAASILLSKNTNLEASIAQIKNSNPQNLLIPVDRKFKNDSVNKQFLEILYTTMYRVFQNSVRGKRKGGIFTPGLNELSQLIRNQLGQEGITITSKNNWNNMKKTSNSINNQEFIRKAAETRVSYFGDADSGLKDQLTKSYYAGLTGMYNEKPQKRSSDYKDLYGFQEETGEDLILEAHPKSVTLADAMGKGGLVENGLEQKEKSTYVALTTPTGNFHSKYASTIGYLQKLAKAADEQGKKEVSRLIKQTIQNLK